MDKDVVLSKLESLRRCLQRVQNKTPASVDLLIEDYDLQDIIALNLERAIQTCVDIGLHIISDLEVPVPETMAQTFETLKKPGVWMRQRRIAWLRRLDSGIRQCMPIRKLIGILSIGLSPGT